MKGTEIARLYGFTAFSVRANTKDLGHEESLVAPEKGGNCANHVLGHILHSREEMFALAGLEPFSDPGALAAYARGSDPITAARATPLTELLQSFERSQELLASSLASMQEADLEKAVPEGTPEFLGRTVGEAVAAFMFHEAYHAGQLGILRRAVGLPGVIA